MKWLITVMDLACRTLALLLQLAGLSGVVLAVLIGLWALAGRIQRI